MLWQDGDALGHHPCIGIEPGQEAAHILIESAEQMNPARIIVADMQEPHWPVALGDFLGEVMLRRQAVEAAAADHRDAKRFLGLSSISSAHSARSAAIGLDALGWPPLGDPLTPKLVLVAAGPQVAPELGQNIAPCVGGALVRR